MTRSEILGAFRILMAGLAGVNVEYNHGDRHPDRSGPDVSELLESLAGVADTAAF